MIQLDHIAVTLGGTRLFHDVSATILQGEKVALSGESGSGKTTLLKALIGWHVPTEGTIRIGGDPLRPDTLPAIRARTYYLPQDVLAQGEETVDDYLSYPFQLSINRHLQYQPDDALALFDKLKLKRDLLHRPLYELSGGERKRIGLVRGLLLRRPLYLLDEPTSAVDAGNRRAMLDHLLGLEDATVLAITHDEEFMAGAHRHLEMKGHTLKENT